MVSFTNINPNVDLFVTEQASGPKSLHSASVYTNPDTHDVDQQPKHFGTIHQGKHYSVGSTAYTAPSIVQAEETSPTTFARFVAGENLPSDAFLIKASTAPASAETSSNTPSNSGNAANPASIDNPLGQDALSNSASVTGDFLVADAPQFDRPFTLPDIRLAVEEAATPGADEGVDEVVGAEVFEALIETEEAPIPPSTQTIIGTASGETIVGDDDTYDTIYGLGGNDRLYGGDGNDTIYGGDGNDRVYGEEGSDTLYGDAGADRVYGGVGDDIAYGGEGNDRVYGEEGNDTLYGDAGNDQLRGDAGEDILYGGEGVDNVRGGTGDDTAYGGEGNDRVYGQAGDDTLYGDAGDDRLYGGSGDDTLFGGEGNDLLYGQAGDDTFLFGNDSGADFANGGKGGGWIDTVELSDVTGGPSGALSGPGSWTLDITNGAVATVDPLTQTVSFDKEARGTITLDDGSTLDFNNIEEIAW